MTKQPVSLRHPCSTYEYSICGDVVAIVDLDEGASVTNDAEGVIQDLVMLGLKVDGKIILYRDSAGRWDRLATKGGRFAGLISVGERTYTDARAQVLNREYAKANGANGRNVYLPYQGEGL